MVVLVLREYGERLQREIAAHAKYISETKWAMVSREEANSCSAIYQNFWMMILRMARAGIYKLLIVKDVGLLQGQPLLLDALKAFSRAV